jgi:prepilin-type N-terminal cleavage/methylation domain-containing protein
MKAMSHVSSAPRRLRRAFTLVELLVVIGIIGILTSMILPAVQSAREAGRRSVCLNNLRQLGTAVQNHLQQQSVFPAGAAYYSKTTGKVATGPTAAEIAAGVRHSWPTALLPYLEETAIHRKYNFNVGWNHNKNKPIIIQPIKLLNCPSVPHSEGERVTIVNSANGAIAAVSDYMVIEAVGNVFYNALGVTPPGAKAQDGLPDREIRLKAALVRDGLSKTLMIEEDAGRPSYYVAPTKLGPLTVDYANKQDIVNGIALGSAWAQPDNMIGLHGTHYDGLSNGGTCFMNCTNNNEVFSFHPGGSCAALGDSGVRFVSDETDPRVFAAAVTRSGGESESLP